LRAKAMTSGPAVANANGIVLVVLSSEQREARRSALSELERPGIELLFEESPVVALDLIAQTPPALVLVGMVVGDMEGLEFLALLLKRVPGFPGKVVVLPDTGDPFPPMLQGRDPVTKKSTTTAIDMPGIAALVAEIAPANLARAPAAPPPNKFEPPASPPPRAPAAAAAPLASAATFEPTEAPRQRRSPLVYVVPAAATLLLVIGLIVAKASGPAPTPVASAQPSAVSTPAASTAAEPTARATETARPPDPLEQLTTLPLSFARGSADFEVKDAAKLDATIDAIKRTLGSSRLEVGGHTSSDGPERRNEELSLKRAANVKRYLVGKGIPEAQTVLKDYKMAAVASAPDDDSNRRVTVRVLR
jgi:outer membrane protein OmpA-like peptidoglycan-associated protein